MIITIKIRRLIINNYKNKNNIMLLRKIQIKKYILSFLKNSKIIKFKKF